ncbi:MAG TPA: TIGR04282 family arsenosugar biosynthesis glycosyltransferase [Usitatibacter sp.]|nr:TIGR04282 family arsenosugar biosynthesis glycosyltransferase [Usitatibacter sp.]
MRIAVFAKAPVAGRVKTRLAAELGDEGAARLAASLTLKALATAVDSGVGAVELWCSPDAKHPFFAQCGSRFHVKLREQRGADLGDRMEAAIHEALAAGSPVLVTGADCPALDAAVLRQAARALAHHDAVFVPAEDGGYVLVGMARALPGVFEGIAWGEDTVMQQTRERLVRARARWQELDPLWDVDRPEDYRRMRREGFALEAPA